MHSRRNLVIAFSDQSLAPRQFSVLLSKRLTKERQREHRCCDECDQTSQITVPSFREVYATGVCQTQVETQCAEEQRDRNRKKLKRSLQHYVR